MVINIVGNTDYLDKENADKVRQELEKSINTI